MREAFCLGHPPRSSLLFDRNLKEGRGEVFSLPLPLLWTGSRSQKGKLHESQSNHPWSSRLRLGQLCRKRALKEWRRFTFQMEHSSFYFCINLSESGCASFICHTNKQYKKIFWNDQTGLSLWHSTIQISDNIKSEQKKKSQFTV